MVTYMITLFESYIDLVTFIQVYSSNLLHGYIYIVLFFELLAWFRLYSFIPRSSSIVTYMITVFKSYIDLVTFTQFYSSNCLHGYTHDYTVVKLQRFSYIYIVLFFQLLAWLHLYSFILRTSSMVTYMITLFESYKDLVTFLQFYSSSFLHGYIYIVLFFELLARLHLFSFILRTSCMVPSMITLFESSIDLDTFISFYSSNFSHGYIHNYTV